MAKAYLGKISALVTANTSDFNSKLNASAKEVRSFAASMQGSLSRAESSAASSLRGIYTEAQKVERALRAASSLRLSFKGIDTSKFKEVSQAADQMRRVVSAAEQIYKPLQSAAKATEALSNEVRGEFQPALIAAQRQAELMNAALSSGLAISEKSFARVQRRAEETAQAVKRLVEASAAVGSLSSGRELRFQSPQFAKALQDAQSIQQRANAIDPVRGAALGVGTAVENQRRAAQAAARADARVEAARLRLDNDPSGARDGILASAESNAAKATAAFNAANEALEKIVSSEEQAADAARDFAAATKSAEAAAKSQAEAFDRLKASAQQALTGIPQSASQARQEFDGLLSQIGKLNATGRGAVSPLTNELISLFEAAGNGDDNLGLIISKLKELKGVVAEVGDINSLSIGASSPYFPGNGRGNPTGSFGPALPPGFGGRSDAGVGAEIEDPTRRLEVLRGRVVSVKSTIDALPDSIRARLLPDISAIDDKFREVAAAPELARGRILGLAESVSALEAALAKVARSQQFLASVGSTPLAISENLDTSVLAGYEAQLRLLQRTMVGVSDTAKGTLTQAMAAVNNAIDAAFAGGFTREARREIDGMINGLTALTAAEAKVSFSRLGREVARIGDVGRQGFDRYSLALQQAGYAIDDFFSVTGGFDQRLRAISNNITQLAFILGGTTGLFIGLGAVIVGQGVSALIKWANNGRTAEDRTKALNDALERQKSIVESLAESFRSLGDTVSRGFFSESGEAARSFAADVDRLVKKQKELRDERVLDADPAVRREKAEQAKLQRQISASGDYAERVGLQSQLDASRQREERARVVLRLPPPDAGEVREAIRRRAPNPFRNPAAIPEGNDIEAIRARRAALEGPLERLREILADGPSAFDGGARFAIAAESYDRLNSLATRLDAALSEAVDAAAASVINSARGPAQVIERGQALIQEAISAGVLGATIVQANLESLGDTLKSAFTSLENAYKEADPAQRELIVNAARDQIAAVQSQIAATEQEVAAIDAARNSLERFKDALDRVAQEADQNLQSAQRRADEARANDLGRGTDRTADDRRRAEADLEDQRQARNRVDQEVAVARERARQNPATRDIESQIADINELLQYESSLPARQREELVAERARLQRQADENVRQQVENDPRVRAARDDSTRVEQQQQSADRGDVLRRTPAQRAADDLVGQLADIRQSFGRQAEQGTGLVDVKGQRTAQRRAVEDAMRSTAPAIFGMADEVQNALLQGPSRAALQATDVSTVQGATELNRLLRGDDSARNQNLVELQKQSTALEELVTIARDNGAPPGIFD